MNQHWAYVFLIYAWHIQFHNAHITYPLPTLTWYAKSALLGAYVC